ncbi:hypothetical protein AB4347_05665 [Vibrio breoganii]
MSKSWLMISIVVAGYYSLEAFNDHMNYVVLTSSNEQLQKLHQNIMCDNKPELTYFESLISSKAGWALRERGRVDLSIEVSNSCRYSHN